MSGLVPILLLGVLVSLLSTDVSYVKPQYRHVGEVGGFLVYQRFENVTGMGKTQLSLLAVVPGLSS